MAQMTEGGAPRTTGAPGETQAMRTHEGHGSTLEQGGHRLIVPLVLDRGEVRLPKGSKVLICSDLHLGATPTDASMLVSAEIGAKLNEWSEPGAVVLNGDCFELLATTEPSIDATLDAHPEFEQALVDFASGSDRHVIVTVGNHDSQIAWNPEALHTLQLRLRATVFIVVDLLLDTDRGVRVVRVEHGHQFDPANAFQDPRDPYDSPLGQHIAQEVLPELAGQTFLSDVASLSDPNEFARFLGSRVVYRELIGRAWWLGLPFIAALLIRTPFVVRGLSDARGDQIGRWLLVVGVGITADVIALGLVAVLVARRVFQTLAYNRLGPRGANQNDPPRAAGEALCAEGFAGFVTGHSHHPELMPLPTGFYANSGCGVQTLEARPGRAGLPPVFTGVLRRSWVELETSRDLETRLVVAETPVPGSTRLERLCTRSQTARPTTPTVVCTLPGGASWPIRHAGLRSAARREQHRKLAAGLVLAVAAIDVVSAVTPPLRDRLHSLLQVMPVELPQAASATLVFVSVALLLLARGLRRGHRLAWLTTVGVLGLSTILHLLKGGDVEEATAALLIAVWLISRQSDFPVRPSSGTVRRGVIFSLTVAGAAITVSLLLVQFLGAHRRPDIDKSLRALAERLVGHQVLPLPGNAPFVTPALTATGLGIGIVLIWLLLGPRRPRPPSALEHQADQARARRIIELHGGDTLTYFALRDDKDWFFTGSSVVAYSLRNGVCLVSPDPIGPSHEWADTWAEFTAFADRHGWAVTVVGAQPGWLPVYAAAGMQAIYMGDEAIVDCQAFSLEGRNMKSLRGTYNRVKKAGYTMLFLDPCHIEPEMKEALLDLMTETRHGEAERGFSMTLSRIFNPSDTGLLLSVALDPEGRPAAFCQWVPATDIDGWSLDMMRRRADPDLTNGVTDFVVIETIEHVKATHQWGICLNFAVMRAVVAGDLEGAFYNLQRRVLRKFSETMQIESLWLYNKKFRPYWRARYVVLDAVENAPAASIAIADAESIWELPIIGRFLGRSR